jgi:outer membrane phospholipase A
MHFFQRLSVAVFILWSLMLSVRAVFADEAAAPMVQLQQYRPIYVIAGRPDVKVQISFKGQILRSFDLYYAYSQLMIWDFFKDSSPFRDINYNPELFYRIHIKRDSALWLDLGGDHESNGRAGAASRSWNRAYALIHSTHSVGEKAALSWSFRAWYPFSYSENADILQYRGLWEAQVGLSQFLGPFFYNHELSLRLYGGGKSHVNPLKGGQELTFRTNLRSGTFAPAIVLQVFHGFGEYMLNYRDERLGLRAGLGF